MSRVRIEQGDDGWWYIFVKGNPDAIDWAETEKEAKKKRQAVLVEYARHEIELYSLLKAEYKRRARIFQCEMKEYYALQDGLPYDAYHKLSFKEWLALEARKKAEYDAKLKQESE